MTTEELERALDLVAAQIADLDGAEWDAPTPCTEWCVRDVVIHLVGANRVFGATLAGQPLPTRGADPLGADPVAAFRESGRAVVAGFRQPGVMERTFAGPLGDATGQHRLNLRIADLLTHAWDLAQATGRPVDIPEDLAERAFAFAQTAFDASPRGDRFAPPQPAPANASPLDRLIALSGRPNPT